jgi:polyhydroxyalkanoate synthesis repressor PhaR
MTEPRLIRKYANRRLYDTVASRHVTHADIRALIAAGHKVKVVEDKSGEDITRPVLLQAIAEQEQGGAPVLSTELLEIIIRFYASPLQATLTRYLEQGFTALLTQQQAMQAEMTKAFQVPMGPFGELARNNMEALARMQAALFGVRPDSGTPPKPEPAAEPDPTSTPPSKEKK